MSADVPTPLSAAQNEIMEIVWEHGELSVFEVRQILAQRRPIARETVRTLLGRMEEKGWLSHRMVGRTYLYSAAVPKDATVGRKIVEILETMCGGSAERLMTALLDYRGLSDEEANRIQEMIEQARREDQPEGSS